MTLMLKKWSLGLNCDWYKVIVYFSLIGIILHLIISWGHFFPHSIYTLADIPLLLVVILGGTPIFLQIFYKVIKGDFGADFLAIIAVITAIILHEYLAAALVILMLSGGQALERYALDKASSVLQELAKRVPSKAHHKKDGFIQEIKLSDITIGDHLVIYPHETVPADGFVIEGHGTMDESYLTGEPYHVAKSLGSPVLSGSTNGSAALTIQVEKLPIDSRYATIMKVMQEAEQKRPRIRRLGDQIGTLFAPLAIVIALISWLLTGQAIRFLVVLVVATPCPLLIAIPITLISAISMAARQNIIIKDPTVLEQLPLCRTAIFDKTGTLTYGRPKLTEIITAPGVDAFQILQKVASLEKYSQHPLASPILTMAKQSRLSLIEPTCIQEHPGQGLTGTIDGHQLIISSRQKIVQLYPELASYLPAHSTGLECIVVQDELYVATFHFRDIPRKKSKSFIKHLKNIHHFKKIMLVSGDQASEVDSLAKGLGIKNSFSNQSPEQKLAIIQREVTKAPTLFMGDGINDAPALAIATVGISFGHHSPVTSKAAGAVIMDSSLEKVDELIHISTMMRRIMLQSALGGMALSLIAMDFASFGYISPVLGALLQEFIDVLAIINALRLSWIRKVEIDLPP